MTPALKVSGFSRSPRRGMPAASGLVGDFQLEFCGEAMAMAPERGDAFLACALLPAMSTGQVLEFRDFPPVSATLLHNVDLIQEIWTTWNRSLSRVEIKCDVVNDEVPGRGTATFFSGGVDAIHAALVGGEPDERLVFLNGFDFDMSPDDFARATDRNRGLADRLGMSLITVETNFIWLSRKYLLSRATTHGGLLGGIAHLIAPRRMTIASTNGWDHLDPLGSHVLLDSLWSSGQTQVRHFGIDCARTEKVAAIAKRPDLLEDLWVCFEDSDRNCGRCSKCIRTRAALHLLGASYGPFPAGLGDPLAAYGRVAERALEREFLPDMLRLARESNQPHLEKTLLKAERKLLRRDVLRRLRDAVPFLGAHLRGRAELIELRPGGPGGPRRP